MTAGLSDEDWPADVGGQPTEIWKLSGHRAPEEEDEPPKTAGLTDEDWPADARSPHMGSPHGSLHGPHGSPRADTHACTQVGGGIYTIDRLMKKND